MSEPKCGTCKWWDKARTKDVRGDCTLAAENYRAASYDTAMFLSYQLRTNVGFACNQWQAKEGDDGESSNESSDPSSATEA